MLTQARGTALFIAQSILRPADTGAIVPSSKSLADLYVRAAQLPGARSVVEIGSGTGTITAAIMKSIPRDTVFFSIEINAHFVSATRAHVPGAIVYHDSADTIARYLSVHDITMCDRVLSGLPWTLFDEEKQKTILQAVYDALEPNGIFVTMAYVHGARLSAGRRLHSILRSTFSTVTKTRVVWNNVPPAFLYVCVK